MYTLFVYFAVHCMCFETGLVVCCVDVDLFANIIIFLGKYIFTKFSCTNISTTRDKGDDWAPGQQSPYFFNVKYKGVSENFFENSAIFISTWNGIINIIDKIDASLPDIGVNRDTYDEWLEYLQPGPNQVC